MTDYEKLKQIIDEIPNLIGSNVSASDVSFKTWKTKAERFLINRYGKASYEYTDFSATSFSLHLFTIDTPHSEFVKACRDGLRKTQAVFQTYLDEISEQKSISTNDSVHYTYSKVFIVHGHDNELKQSVARIIEKQGIEAVILSEKANKGSTIIEKFENYCDVGGAICLFTADDLGKAKNEEKNNTRARQNVVFETGFFMGKLGRDHIVILADQGIEIPSDLSGVVYTSTEKWEIELFKELKAIGYKIDFNLLF